MTIAPAETSALTFEELDPMDAPSWESFYQGLLTGIGAVGIVVGIAT